MIRLGDKEPSYPCSQMVEIIVTNFGRKSPLRDENVVICLPGVQFSLSVELTNSNQQTKLTNVGFQQSNIPLASCKRRSSNYLSKPWIERCTIGLVNTFTHMVEDWPIQTRLWGIQSLLLVNKSQWSLVFVRKLPKAPSGKFKPWRFPGFVGSPKYSKRAYTSSRTSFGALTYAVDSGFPRCFTTVGNKFRILVHEEAIQCCRRASYVSHSHERLLAYRKFSSRR